MEIDNPTLIHNKAALYKELGVHELVRGRYQPRQNFEQAALGELSNSIKQVGVLEPLIVRPLSPSKYEIVAGERRWRAAQLAGLHSVPCIIRELDDRATLQIALIENIVRRNLNPVEEAEAIARLIEEFDYTHEAAASALGKSRPDITNLLQLLKLDPRVKTLLMEGDLTKTHGRLLAVLPLTEQYGFAREAVVKSWSHRALEKAIKQYQANRSLPETIQEKKADLKRLEQNVSDYFGAEVKVDLEEKSKGWLKIYFNSNDELEGILERAGYKDE